MKSIKSPAYSYQKNIIDTSQYHLRRLTLLNFPETIKRTKDITFHQICHERYATNTKYDFLHPGRVRIFLLCHCSARSMTEAHCVRFS